MGMGAHGRLFPALLMWPLQKDPTRGDFAGGGDARAWFWEETLPPGLGAAERCQNLILEKDVGDFFGGCAGALFGRGDVGVFFLGMLEPSLGVRVCECGSLLEGGGCGNLVWGGRFRISISGGKPRA